MSVLDNNDYESECPYCYKYKQNFMGKLSRLLKNREKKTFLQFVVWNVMRYITMLPIKQAIVLCQSLYPMHYIK